MARRSRRDTELQGVLFDEQCGRQRSPGAEEILRDTVFELMQLRFTQAMVGVGGAPYRLPKDQDEPRRLPPAPHPLGVLGLEMIRQRENTIAVLNRIRIEIEAVLTPEIVERAHAAARESFGLYTNRARRKTWRPRTVRPN